MCILLNVKKHEKTFALNVDIFKAQEICNLMNTYSQNYSKIEIDGLGKLHVN